MKFQCERCRHTFKTKTYTKKVYDACHYESGIFCPKCGALVEKDEYVIDHAYVSTGERSGLSYLVRCVRCHDERWRNPLRGP
jgi:cytochrome c553